MQPQKEKAKITFDAINGFAGNLLDSGNAKYNINNIPKTNSVNQADSPISAKNNHKQANIINTNKGIF